MDLDQLKDFLASAPLSEEDKNEILEAQVKGASLEELANLIEAKLDKIENDILESDPELAAEYSRIQSELQQELLAAEQEFKAEMAGIESDFKALEREIDKELDGVRMEQLKLEQQEL